LARSSSVCAVTVALAGCGVETASTAATAAALKKQELEQGKKANAAVAGENRRRDAAGAAAGRKRRQIDARTRTNTDCRHADRRLSPPRSDRPGSRDVPDRQRAEMYFAFFAGRSPRLPGRDRAL